MPNSVVKSLIAVMATLFSTINLNASPIAVKDFSPESGKLLHKIAIIGKDTRRHVPLTHQRLSDGIGIIIPTSGRHQWGCTAFCASDDVIATNAHCLIRGARQKQKVDLSNILFAFPKAERNKKTDQLFINYRAGGSYLKYVTPFDPRLSIYMGNYYNRRNFRFNAHDWAFVKLQTPVCKKRVLTIKDIKIKTLLKASRQKRIFMLGYHGDDFLAVQKLSPACRIFSPHNRRYLTHSARRHHSNKRPVLPHNCDTVTGSSGSPVFMKEGKNSTVIGINRGSFKFAKYQVYRDNYTGRPIGRPRLVLQREINTAVHSRAFLKGLERFKSEDLLDTIEEFEEVQQHLKQLRLYRSNVDGIMGRGTRSAIIKFEKKNKLEPLGLPTKQLLTRLRLAVNPIAKTDKDPQKTAKKE